ncbi:hypothetical protein GCM10027321_41450 [Massilia terrae]
MAARPAGDAALVALLPGQVLRIAVVVDQQVVVLVLFALHGTGADDAARGDVEPVAEVEGGIHIRECIHISAGVGSRLCYR